MVPCPISERTIRTTTSSFDLTTTHTPISGVAKGALGFLAVPANASGIPIENPIANPVPTVAVPIIKFLREIFAAVNVILISLTLGFANSVNCFAYLLESAAPADI